MAVGGEQVVVVALEAVAAADVVYAVRSERQGETAFKRTTASWFYRLFRSLADIDLTPESGDFRLMDRRALDALLRMPERNRFLRGMSVWVGFNQTAVTFQREARSASNSGSHEPAG